MMLLGEAWDCREKPPAVSLNPRIGDNGAPETKNPEFVTG